MFNPLDPPVYPHTYTYIDDVGYVCNDCGAHAETEDDVVHYPTCAPGTSEFWQEIYDQQADDVEETDAYQEGSLRRVVDDE